MSAAEAPRRFPCTPAGAVARGRRRLALLLLGLAAAMAVVAVGAWIAGRWLPGLLALGVSFLLWTAWQMSHDLDPLWLELGGGRLEIQLRRGRVAVPLPVDGARRLSQAETAHIERLASRGGIVAGSGSYDSHRLGEFDLYASNLGAALLVEAGETRVVVTPDDPDSLLHELGWTPAGRGSPPATILAP